MIAVIADDLTGAAETGGVGLRHGLTAEVQTEVHADSSSDLIVVDTDTRSADVTRAGQRVAGVTGALAGADPEWVYKKVDSVFRGHVLEELQALISHTSANRALLIPANPSLGRTIRDGRYLVHGQALHETDFSRDPESPIATSDVLELLGTSPTAETCFLAGPQKVPAGTVAVGAAQGSDDLLAWASVIEPGCVPAGASEFFSAILETRGHAVSSRGGANRSEEARAFGNKLFVCGSSSDYSRSAVRKARALGAPVVYIPPGLFRGDMPPEPVLEDWTHACVAALDRHSLVIAAIDQPVVRDPDLARTLRDHMAVLAETLLSRTPVHEVVVEGGATASAIVRRLAWSRLFPCVELAPGVVRMRLGKREPGYLTIKPGSYAWPEGVFPGL
jgi:uncharacterized protein YgbK (DUF1537 family)